VYSKNKYIINETKKTERILDHSGIKKNKGHIGVLLNEYLILFDK